MDLQNSHPGTSYPFFYVYLKQFSPVFDGAFDKVNKTGLPEMAVKNACVDLPK